MLPQEAGAHGEGEHNIAIHAKRPTRTPTQHMANSYSQTTMTAIEVNMLMMLMRLMIMTRMDVVMLVGDDDDDDIWIGFRCDGFI